MSIRHPDVARIIQENSEYLVLYHSDPVWRAWIFQFDKIVSEVALACRDEDVDSATADRIVSRLIDRALPVDIDNLHARMKTVPALKEIP